MEIALAGICLALILALPVSLHIVAKHLRQIHADTLDFIEATQLVHGTPAHIATQREEFKQERIKEQDQSRKPPRINQVVSL